MEVAIQCSSSSVWDGILELTKWAQGNRSDPLLWAIQVSSNLNAGGVSLPSFELGDLLISYICWENNVPIAWKFLEKAIVCNILPPLPVLALLSIRVIPNRHSWPAAYRIYLELLKQHAFKIKSLADMPNYQKITNSLDTTLQFAEVFGMQENEPGVLVIEIVFSIIWQLLDASLDDEGLLQLTTEKKSRWPTKPPDMEIDGVESYDGNRLEHKEKLKNGNTIMAVDLIGQFLQNKVTSRILYLARQNMPTQWGGFLQRIKLLVANSKALRNSKVFTPEALMSLISYSHNTIIPGYKISSSHTFPPVMPSRSLSHTIDRCHGFSPSALWLPLDLALEDAMDGSQVNATSAVEIVTGLVKALHAVNGSTWHETFLGLWKAALYLVQRERDPIEGPVPRLDTRLSMLLSITTLVVADLIEEEEGASINEVECGIEVHGKKPVPGNRRKDLVSCLQNLGDYQILLKPPHSAISAANQAAAKAMMFVSGINVSSTYFECISMTDVPINCSGNLRHLIVESCIARNLLDTSAYFWPGYANGNINQLPHTVPTQIPTWSAFMKGAPLTPALTNALISSPASRYACVAFLIQWFSLSTLINQAVPSYFTECESTSPVYYLDKGILLYEYLR